MKRILAALLVSAGTMTVSLFGAGTNEPAVIYEKGRIEYLEGDVFVDGVPADFGQELETGSVLSTGTASFCEILFGERNIFRLEENTVIRINIDLRQKLQSVDLNKGALSAVFTKIQIIGGQKGSFSITTPTAVAGIRGTAFFIKVEDQNNTYICTCNGITALQDNKRSIMKRVRAESHRAFRFTKSTNGTTASQAKLLYHSNSSMDRLAEKISYTIPWGPNRDRSY